MMIYTTFGSPIGHILLVAEQNKIITLTLVNAGEELTETLPSNAKHQPESLRPQQTAIMQYLGGRSKTLSLPLDLRGTDFQKQVWQALQTIPHGQTRSYADIARQIGRPAAMRAVGQACGRNPVMLAVPCHRVIAASGALGGFSRHRKLLGVKEWLLELECSSMPDRVPLQSPAHEAPGQTHHSANH